MPSTLLFRQAELFVPNRWRTRIPSISSAKGRLVAFGQLVGHRELPFPMPSSASTSSLAADDPCLRPPTPPRWPRAVALDVEFSHYVEQNDTKQRRIPADVAVVGDGGEVLFRSLVRRPETPTPTTLRWVGGVPFTETDSRGLELERVVEEVCDILSGGCLLVGHGIAGDLGALGVGVTLSSSSSPSSPSYSPPRFSISASRTRDTSAIPLFLKKKKNGRSSSSSSRKLHELFLEAFGVELRPPSTLSSPVRHDAVADAAAAMALYVCFVRGTLEDTSDASGGSGRLGREGQLVELEAERVLLEFRSRQQRKTGDE